MNKEILERKLKEFGVDIDKESIYTQFLFNSLVGVASSLETLQKENAKLRECVTKLSKEETPYRIHEHRDALEERLHNLIIKARKTLKELEGGE